MSTEIYKGHAMFFYGAGSNIDEIQEKIKELEAIQIKVLRVRREKDLFECSLITKRGEYKSDNVLIHLKDVLTHEDPEKFL